MSQIKHEAEVITRYLIGQNPTDLAVSLYTQNVERMVGPMSPSEKRIWEAAIKWPLLLQILDSGLAMTNHFSPIRHRIYIMLSILETQPEFSSHFLPKRVTILDYTKLILHGATALLFTFVGLIVVSFVGLRKSS